MIQTHIPLSQAAFELGRSYHQTLKLLMTRELDGERRDGRWFVSAESLERAKQRAAQAVA